MRPTTQDLIDAVRSIADESNEANIKDRQDILPALNRAQDLAANILARKYPEPLIGSTTLVTQTGVTYIPIPADALEGRIERLEHEYMPGLFRPIEAISFRKTSSLESPSKAQYPTHYTQTAQGIRIMPAPISGLTFRLWYPKEMGTLVMPQGTVIRTPSNVQTYLLCQDIGTEISEEQDSAGSYFNVINSQTGAIRGTFQCQSIQDGRLGIRATPTRSVVQGRTVLGSLADLDIQADDMLCSFKGSCIPFLPKPLANFLIEFAVCELRIKTGEDGQREERLKQEFENMVERTWVGRESTQKVVRRNYIWSQKR